MDGDTQMGGSPVTATSSVEAIKQFVTTRYIPEQKFLRFDEILNDPVIKSAGIRHITENMMKVMFSLASQQYSDVCLVIYYLPLLFFFLNNDIDLLFCFIFLFFTFGCIRFRLYHYQKITLKVYMYYRHYLKYYPISRHCR